MNYFELWKVGADLLLLISLGFLCLRFAKAPSAGVDSERLYSLEGTIKGLIRDADASSKALSDQLSKRRDSLEKLLYELETAEHRINKSITSAEEQKGALAIELRRAEETSKRLVEEARSHQSAGAWAADSYLEMRQQPAPPKVKPEARLRHEPGAISLSDRNALAEAPEPLSFSEASEQPSQEPAAGRRAARNPRLAASLEKEIESGDRSQREDAIMAGVWQAADRAMRIGKEAQSETIERKTAQNAGAAAAISDREIPAPQPLDQARGDPRLGVLGGIRRAVQVL